ncbi:MAG TPA: heme exporter protein CcmD [Caulobacteraceae bacterium]|jgi:heme exporter protein CcmD
MSGRYAAFVIAAYAVSAAAFAWMIVDTLVRARRARCRLEKLESARPA